MEVSLYLIIDILFVIESLSIGFAQTSDSEEVVELFEKGAIVAKKQYMALGELLTKSELPIPPVIQQKYQVPKKEYFLTE